MEKIVLHKEYERDFCLVLEQGWCRALSQDLETRFAFKNQDLPYYLLYGTKENLQFWEHAPAVQNFFDWLLERNMSDTGFIEHSITEYSRLDEELKHYKDDPEQNDLVILTKYISLLQETTLQMSTWYYSGVDERTPEALRKRLVTLRESDNLFASNDSFIRKNLEFRGVPRDLTNLVLTDEFVDLPKLSELEKRGLGTVVIDGLDMRTQSLESFARENENYDFVDLNTDFRSRSEVSGNTAYKGIVRGVVRVVKNKHAAAQVVSGEIMVSPMTTPDFIDGMYKASAFVTDEGGIMCHAAIVAREMKKPCVIGTKIASRVFKDGDMVEVDAEKGVVRKI